MYIYIIEFLYFRGKYRGKLLFASILKTSILEEIIEIYIRDALNHLVDGVCSWNESTLLKKINLI